jgi:hypothetical protein
MAALSIQVPYPVFYDRDGQPIDNGNIYIGVANLDPVTNPIQVYYDEALTITASQPLKTSNGYVYRNGTPAQLYVDAVNFSITVKDSKNTLVYNFPDGTGIPQADASAITFTGVKGQSGFVSDLGDSDGSDWIGYVPPGLGAVARSAQDKMRDFINVKDFGAVGDGVTDDTNAFTLALAAASCVHVPAGSYKITSTIQVPTRKTLQGVGYASRLVASSVVGPVIGIGNGGASAPTRVTVSGFNITGTATSGLQVNLADGLRVEDISLEGLTATRGFVFKRTWSSSFRDLMTNGATISGECFAVGQDFNANDCANWYTSNFCSTNVLLDGSLDGGIGASHGSNFQNITVQGGNVGLYIRQFQGATFDTVYEENTVLPVRLGDHTVPRLARAITIRNLNTEGPGPTHPDIANRTAVVFFSYALGCKIDTPDLGAAYNIMNIVPVTITGDGTGASAVAITNHAGAIVGVQVIKQGSGYTSASVSFGGTGTGATATATVATGLISAITVTSGGTGYAPSRGCLAAYRYHTAVRCVVDTPFIPAATGFKPTWPWLVRAPGALSISGVIIRNDISGQDWDNTADLLRNREYAYRHVLMEIADPAAVVLRKITPVVL